MRFLFLFLIVHLFLVSCGSKESNVTTTQAISTAEHVRNQWLKVRKPLEFQLDVYPHEHTPLLNKVGVYSMSSDATMDEKLMLNGMPFLFSDHLFRPESGSVITGDTTAIFYVCYPFIPGLTLKDTLVKKAPFTDFLYGLNCREVYPVVFLCG